MPRLLERPSAGRAVTPEATAHAALAAARGGEAVAEVAAVVAHGDGMRAGRRMLVWAERTAGTLGDPEVDREAVRLAREALRDGTAPGTREVAVDGRGCTLFLECHRPPPELVIVGAGHIARPLCRIGAMLGFRVRVLDDRPEFATRERFPEAEECPRTDFADPFEAWRSARARTWCW
jgi:xanthine dehydrogenase accessory factor